MKTGHQMLAVVACAITILALIHDHTSHQDDLAIARARRQTMENAMIRAQVELERAYDTNRALLKNVKDLQDITERLNSQATKLLIEEARRTP